MEWRAKLLLFFCPILVCGQSTATVQGHVFATDGSRVGGATVTISGASVVVQITDSSGGYSSPNLPAGYYEIVAAKDGYRQAVQKVTLDADRQIDLVLNPPCNACAPDAKRTAINVEGMGTLSVVLLFLSSIWLVRWHNIARPNRALLSAEIDDAKVRFQNDTGVDLNSADVKYLKDLLDAAALEIVWNWRSSWFDFFFWTRGQEITGWARIHEFQRASVKYLAKEGSLDTIRARLQAIVLDLLDIDKTHAKTFAANIKDALEAAPPDEGALRALLVEALTYLNDQIDSTFAQLTGWQTKAVWLAGIGCALVVVLASTVGNPVLFIAGAAGGFLSRLARTLKRADVPTDYGASWTTLFLSPIVGALTGWFGILLIVVLADNQFKVLGAAFQSVRWCCPLAPFTLGLAFAMGFSERLFDGIVASLETKVDNDRKAATKPQEPSSGIAMAKKKDS
jgi:hypothetical protein